KQKVIIGLFGILTIISLWGASKIKFDYFLMQDLNEDHSLMKDLRFFQTNYSGIRPFELAIIPKGDYKIDDFEVLKEIDQLSNYLDTAYQVNQMLDPTVPYKFVNQLMRDNKNEFYRLPENPK